MSVEHQSSALGSADQPGTDYSPDKHLPTQRVLVDAHAHLHACFDIEKALQSALANFRQWASTDEAGCRDSLAPGVAEQGQVDIDTVAVQAADRKETADDASCRVLDWMPDGE